MQDDWPDTPHGQAENRARDLERKLAMLTAPPRKLAPSEVTEPGWYWAKETTGEIGCVLIAPPERGDFALVALVIDDRVGVGWPLAEFAWFVGPLSPPEA